MGYFNKPCKGVEKRVDKWLRLITILNSLKLEDQFYRSSSSLEEELVNLVNLCAKEDLLFTAQCIIYARCVGDGMRTVSHVASATIAPYLAGTELGKYFYGLWDKKGGFGGIIYRPDDMMQIVNYWISKNNKSIPNAMKKGFRNVVEKLDSYSLIKYKKDIIDISNLVHPRSYLSTAFTGNSKTLDLLMKGNVTFNDTWETAYSTVGKEVSNLLENGIITEYDIDKELSKKKEDVWDKLLSENKLNILAAIRNIRNILEVVNSSDIIDKLCKLLSDKDKIVKGKIMPYQIDMVLEVLERVKESKYKDIVLNALKDGYLKSIPNLKEVITGNNLVIIDMSNSMNKSIYQDGKSLYSSCLDKASLIAATIAVATEGDIIRFGSNAEYVEYDKGCDLFKLSKDMKSSMGSTNLEAAWILAKKSGKKYDRVFILSDNECNRGNAYVGYKKYINELNDPYVYSIDLAGYGKHCLVGERIRFYYGYGYTMFNDIVTCEFNPLHHIEKIKKINLV